MKSMQKHECTYECFTLHHLTGITPGWNEWILMPPFQSTHGVNSSMSEGDSRADWDIGDADDNTKRFYGQWL